VEHSGSLRRRLGEDIQSRTIINQNKRKEPASGRGKGIPGFLEKWIKRKNQ